MSIEIDKAKIAVRKSPVREEIVRELYFQSDLRPTELWERIEDRVDTSKENFYQNLSALTGHVVDRVEGSRRMTLYSLTDLGREVAEELNLTMTEEERVRSFAYDSNLSFEEMVELLQEFQEEKQD